jgi:hypothetical protein
MKRALAVLAILAITTEAASAQTPVPRGRARETAPRAEPPPERRAAPSDDWREIQRQFGQLLQQYPPSVAAVLRADPSLLANESYLAPYAGLSDFLATHPEIAHNPSFFLGPSNLGWDGRWDGGNNRDGGSWVVNNIFEGLFTLLGVLGVVGTIGWLLRSLAEHRRWLRLSKVQTEAHAKLMDRLTSNQDVIAYVQSAAGRRFLEGAPISVSTARPPLSAPVSRILFSLQAGAVVGFGGAGLLLVSRRLAQTSTLGIDIPLFVVGAVAVAVGVGFIASAALAFGISQRLGLFARPTAAGGTDSELGS